MEVIYSLMDECSDLNQVIDNHYGKGEKTEQGIKYSVNGVDFTIKEDSLIFPISEENESFFESFMEGSVEANELVKDITNKTGLRFIVDA
jgi:hypothetical protein